MYTFMYIYIQVRWNASHAARLILSVAPPPSIPGEDGSEGALAGVVGGGAWGVTLVGALKSAAASAANFKVRLHGTRALACYACMSYRCVCVVMYIYICIFIHIHTRIHIHIHIHTHIHIYIYIIHRSASRRRVHCGSCRPWWTARGARCASLARRRPWWRSGGGAWSWCGGTSCWRMPRSTSTSTRCSASSGRASWCSPRWWARAGRGAGGCRWPTQGLCWYACVRVCV